VALPAILKHLARGNVSQKRIAREDVDRISTDAEELTEGEERLDEDHTTPSEPQEEVTKSNNAEHANAQSSQSKADDASSSSAGQLAPQGPIRGIDLFWTDDATAMQSSRARMGHRARPPPVKDNGLAFREFFMGKVGSVGVGTQDSSNLSAPNAASREGGQVSSTAEDPDDLVRLQEDRIVVLGGRIVDPL